LCASNSLAARVAACLAKELAQLGIFATTVEPGYFRTNFLASASLLRAEKTIEDYAETGGAMREIATEVSYHSAGRSGLSN